MGIAKFARAEIVVDCSPAAKLSSSLLCAEVLLLSMMLRLKRVAAFTATTFGLSPAACRPGAKLAAPPNGSQQAEQAASFRELLQRQRQQRQQPVRRVGSRLLGERLSEPAAASGHQHEQQQDEHEQQPQPWRQQQQMVSDRFLLCSQAPLCWPLLPRAAGRSSLPAARRPLPPAACCRRRLCACLLAASDRFQSPRLASPLASPSPRSPSSRDPDLVPLRFHRRHKLCAKAEKRGWCGGGGRAFARRALRVVRRVRAGRRQCAARPRARPRGWCTTLARATTKAPTSPPLSKPPSPPPRAVRPSTIRA